MDGIEGDNHSFRSRGSTLVGSVLLKIKTSGEAIPDSE